MMKTSMNMRIKQAACKQFSNVPEKQKHIIASYNIIYFILLFLFFLSPLLFHFSNGRQRMRWEQWRLARRWVERSKEQRTNVSVCNLSKYIGRHKNLFLFCFIVLFTTPPVKSFPTFINKICVRFSVSFLASSVLYA